MLFPPLIPHQVVPSDSQENGQTNEEEEMETAEKECKIPIEKRKNSVCEEASEPQTSVSLDGGKQ